MFEAPDPVTAVKAHMEMAGFRQAALADVLGSRSRASEVLSGKRALTLDMIHRLYKEWKIPAEVLIQPYHLAAHQVQQKELKKRAGRFATGRPRDEQLGEACRISCILRLF